MELEKVDSCLLLRMKSGQNVVTPEFVQSFHKALDEAETYKDIKALVTIGEGKYYSTGVAVDAVQSDQEFVRVLDQLQLLLARLLTFPLVTIAAINGHCYGGGALMALCHDYRVMRSDRGWFCVPVVHLKKTIPVAVIKLIKTRIPAPAHHLTITTGKRYTAEEAQAAGIVHEVSSLERLKDSAIAAANRLAGEGLDRNTLTALKYDLCQDVYKTLKEPIRFYSRL